MNFKKDLLLIDLETTGLDSARHEIIQLAAIVLDKKTLKEKASFASFVRPAKWQTRDKESMTVNKISHDQVVAAPPLKKVLGEFEELFDYNEVIISYYGGPLDMDFLRLAYKKVGKKYKFDHHYFNLWGAFFVFLAAKNKLKNTGRFAGFTLDDIMKSFNIRSGSRHDALEDCRVEAEVLRRVLYSQIHG